MRYEDRYASAVHSGNLKSRPETTQSDSDVLGAAGLAAKNEPLALALARLFAGDNSAAREIVDLLAVGAWTKARAQGVRLKRTEATDIARAVLAWHRDGVCRECGGHGYALIPGAPYRSDNECPACKGTTKRPFDQAFKAVHRPIARQVLSGLERELGRAGPAAMAKLAPRLSL